MIAIAAIVKTIFNIHENPLSTVSIMLAGLDVEIFAHFIKSIEDFWSIIEIASRDIWMQSTSVIGTNTSW